MTLRSAFPDIQVGPISSAQYMSRLVSFAIENAGTYRVEDYARHVKDQSTMRAIIAVADDLRRSSEDLKAPKEALDAGWMQLEEIRGSMAEKGGHRLMLSEIELTDD